MKPTGLKYYEEELLDKPSVILPNCAICGRPAHDAHHLIQKGIGGVSKELDKRIPKMTLCGNGNVSGCHGAFHQLYLHIWWREGWVYRFTTKPTNHFRDWQKNADKYVPVPGYLEQK